MIASYPEFNRLRILLKIVAFAIPLFVSVKPYAHL